MRGRSYDVLLRCFAGSLGASHAALFAREEKGDVHVAAIWAPEGHPPPAPDPRDDLVIRCFEADVPLVQSAIDADGDSHSAVAASFGSSERLLGALHATFEPPFGQSYRELVWGAESYARLAGLCMGTDSSLATVLGSAPTDELTGCLSQAGSLEVLEAEVERSQRRGHRLSCCLIDIDGLEEINATRGRSEGDRVLVAAAAALLHSARRYDAVGRYGPDEFIVVLPETGGRGRLNAAERFRDSLRSAVSEATSISIDAFVGVAEWDGESSSNELVQAADQAKRRARAGGGGKVATEQPPSDDPDGLAELTRQLTAPWGTGRRRFDPRREGTGGE